MIMNSCTSSPLFACAPPLRMFIIGMGSVTACAPPRNRYSRTGTMTQFPGYNLSMSNQDTVRQEVVR